MNRGCAGVSAVLRRLRLVRFAWQPPTRRATMGRRYDLDWFNTRKPDLGAIEREWRMRFNAAEKYELRPVDGYDWDIQFDETKITDANDLEFLQYAFNLLRYEEALGEKGNDVEETAQLRLGGYFPPPPPCRFTERWICWPQDICLCYEEDGTGQENSYEWFVWCGPCQCYVGAEEGCGGC